MRFNDLTQSDRNKLTAAELECVEAFIDPIDPLRVTQIAARRGTTPQSVSILLRRAHRKLNGGLGRHRPVSLDSIDETQIVACA